MSKANHGDRRSASISDQVFSKEGVQHRYVIGLGSNIAPRRHYLRQAVSSIARLTETELYGISPVYLTDPVGPPQPCFFNMAVGAQTRLAPESMLDALLEIEGRLGRVRAERWGPRVIDLDLLWGSVGLLEGPRLTLPHPRLTERAFALAPLLDVLPDAPSSYCDRLAALGGPPRVAGYL